jgi:hypothetical protein
MGKSHNKEFHNFYASRRIIGVIKSNRIRLAECVEYMEDKKSIPNVSKKTQERKPLQGPRHRSEKTLTN